MRHYSDSDSAVADVRVGDDKHGIWVAGSLRPQTTVPERRPTPAARRHPGRSEEPDGSAAPSPNRASRARQRKRSNGTIGELALSRHCMPYRLRGIVRPMLKLRLWLGVLLAVCGTGYAVLAFLMAVQSSGDVDVVRSWIEFGLGIVMAGGGVGIAILVRREARKAKSREHS